MCNHFWDVKADGKAVCIDCEATARFKPSFTKQDWKYRVQKLEFRSDLREDIDYREEMALRAVYGEERARRIVKGLTP